LVRNPVTESRFDLSATGARKMIAFFQQIGQKIEFLRLYIACDWIELEPRGMDGDCSMSGFPIP